METFLIYALMALMIVVVFTVGHVARFLLERAALRRHLAYLKGMRMALDNATRHPNGYSRRVK